MSTDHNTGRVTVIAGAVLIAGRGSVTRRTYVVTRTSTCRRPTVPVMWIVRPAVSRLSREGATPRSRSWSRARVARRPISSVPETVASVTTRAATKRTRFGATR